MTRVAHRLAREASRLPCSRWLTLVDLEAGHWHATERGGLGQLVCDHCCRRDDPDGHAALEAWRRVASARAS